MSSSLDPSKIEAASADLAWGKNSQTTIKKRKNSGLLVRHHHVPSSSCENQHENFPAKSRHFGVQKNPRKPNRRCFSGLPHGSGDKILASLSLNFLKFKKDGKSTKQKKGGGAPPPPFWYRPWRQSPGIWRSARRARFSTPQKVLDFERCLMSNP